MLPAPFFILVGRKRSVFFSDITKLSAVLIHTIHPQNYACQIA
jgi:hypothetical protein